MNTFLPLPDFRFSAQVLDDRRLGKQRLEAMQIHRTLELRRRNPDALPTYGWEHHPAVKMWRGYEDALAHYGVAICLEWVGRGHEDNILGYFEPLYRLSLGEDPYDPPPWLGWEELHASHRAMLYLKDQQHYSQFVSDFEATNGSPKYEWPSEHMDKFVDNGHGLVWRDGVRR